jgi:hypothetical protein
MIKPVSVTVLSNYRLHVEFNDGIGGDVDLSHLVGKGVFAAWNDPTAFETVIIGEHGELTWGDDIEICSDAIYLEISGMSAEELFPGLKASADA